MSVPSRAVRERFLDAGLRVLSERGHAGLKLAAVCSEAGTTTGSFYHAFTSWPDYASTLIRYWRETKSGQLIARVRAIPDPRERLLALVDVGLELPHASEAAIRVWAAHDPEVHAVQAEVDAERTRFIADTYAMVIGDRPLAERYAATAMYLLIGHESGTAPSEDVLAWAFRALLDQALGAALVGVGIAPGTVPVAEVLLVLCLHPGDVLGGSLLDRVHAPALAPRPGPQAARPPGDGRGVGAVQGDCPVSDPGKDAHRWLPLGVMLTSGH